MTIHEAYSYMRSIRKPIRKWEVAALIGSSSGDTALLKLECARLLMQEDDQGFVAPMEREL